MSCHVVLVKQLLKCPSSWILLHPIVIIAGIVLLYKFLFFYFISHFPLFFSFNNNFSSLAFSWHVSAHQQHPLIIFCFLKFHPIHIYSFTPSSSTLKNHYLWTHWHFANFPKWERHLQDKRIDVCGIAKLKTYDIR